ncbi:phosphopyruvate hydratase [Botrytis cinerea]
MRLPGFLFTKPIANTGSVARDHLANERTFLSWTRSGLAFVALGVALAKLNALEALSPALKHDHGDLGLPSAALVGSGGGCLSYGTMRYFSSLRLLQKGLFRPNIAGVAFVAVTSVAVAGGGIVLVVQQEKKTIRERLGIASSSIIHSGISKGAYEALELRDGDESIYQCYGVPKAFDVGKDLANIDVFARQIDETSNKSKLGANAIVGISMACTRAGAANVSLSEFLRQQLGSQEPYIMLVSFFSVLNRGVYSRNLMEFQEFMVTPKLSDTETVIKANFDGVPIVIGDEGVFLHPSQSHTRPSISSSHLLTSTAIQEISRLASIQHLANSKSDIYNLGFKEEDTAATETRLSTLEASWTAFSKTYDIELSGDDLLAANTERIKIAEEEKACNPPPIKTNQTDYY